MARLFGTLLHGLGARRTDTFIELKAQQALSLGEEAFSELVHFILNPAEAEQFLQTQQQQRPPQQNPPQQPYSPSPAQKKALVVLKKALKGKPLNVSAGGGGGGVLFIDEAHMLEPAKNVVGRGIVNAILGAAEDHRDELTIILAGYQKDIEQNLYAFDVGMKSRFTDVRFADYDFYDLKRIWNRLLDRYSDPDSGLKWHCSDDTTDIAVRRVAKNSQRAGFGNGRDLRNAFEQAAALAQSRGDFDPLKPEVTTEDVIGPMPDPDTLPDLKAALDELDAMEGLQQVKQSVRQLVELNKRNYLLEKRGEKVLDIKKNRIFWVS